MSVQSEINRISGAKTDIGAAIAEKGVTVPAGTKIDAMAALIEAIQTGVELPTLTNEGAAADLLSGKQLIDDEGNIVTGSMPSVTQATPSISVSTGGLITASATQEAGKVAAGTKSATKQLTVQAAQTITPGTSNKTIASGRYLTGTQTIKGDANLLAENIKSGVSIFGVAGSLEAGSGGGTGGDDVLTGIIGRSVSEFSDSKIQAIGSYAFAACYSLTKVNAPACVSIYDDAFYQCRSLEELSFPACKNIGSKAFMLCFSITSANFPLCTSIKGSAFAGCGELKTLSFPACTTIGANAFSGCTSLVTASFPACTSIGAIAFSGCYRLQSVYFQACTDIGESAFSGCTIVSTVSFPACKTIHSMAFARCSGLQSVNFPACSMIQSSAFQQCSKLAVASFPACTNIRSYAFRSCTSLTALVLAGSSVCSLSGSLAFSNTAIANGSGYIYVPSSLVASYKAATNWTYFSNKISAIEDSPYA